MPAKPVMDTMLERLSSSLDTVAALRPDAVITEEQHRAIDGVTAALSIFGAALALLETLAPTAVHRALAAVSIESIRQIDASRTVAPTVDELVRRAVADAG